MAEAGKCEKVFVVNGRIRGDEAVVGEIAVRELAAHDIRMLGKGDVGGRGHFDVVGYTGVVVAALLG